MTEACVFCEIVSGDAPAKVVAAKMRSIIIEPLGPVTPGHLLVIPRVHVAEAYENPYVTSMTMFDAAEWAESARVNDVRYESVNLITSVGAAATQTVKHLHIHIVPRMAGDGLALPWTGQTR